MMESQNQSMEEQKEEPQKKRLTSRIVWVEYPDYQEVAEIAKQKLVEDEGLALEEAERKINAVWKKFKGREYRYMQFDDWHELFYPQEYLAGALCSMAVYDRPHSSQAEAKKDCDRDCKLVHEIIATVKWGPETKIDRYADFVLGYEQETQNRIAEYLRKYP